METNDQQQQTTQQTENQTAPAAPPAAVSNPSQNQQTTQEQTQTNEHGASEHSENEHSQEQNDSPKPPPPPVAIPQNQSSETSNTAANELNSNENEPITSITTQTIKTVRDLMDKTINNFISLKDFLNMIANAEGASLAQVATWLMFEMHNAHKNNRQTPVPCFLDRSNIGLSIAQPQDLKLFLVSVRDDNNFKKVEKLFKNEAARFGFMKTDFLEFLQRENLNGVSLLKNYTFNAALHPKEPEEADAFSFPLLFPETPDHNQSATAQNVSLKGEFFAQILAARDLLKEQFAGFKNLKNPADVHRFRLQHVQPWLIDSLAFSPREASIVSRLLVQDFFAA